METMSIIVLSILAFLGTFMEGRCYFFQHFVLLVRAQRILDISQDITAENASLHIASN